MGYTNQSKVIIDGNEVFSKATYHVEIAQIIGKPNQFTITLPASSEEGYAAALMDNTIDYIGKKISISYKDTLEFIGLINDISIQKTDAASGTIILSGYSPDILLSRRFDCRSFEEGYTLQDAISLALQEHSSQVLKKSFGSKLGISMPYTVQYNESDHTFINRLCARYGKWLYYNGKELCIGKTGEKEVSGIYGREIRNFALHGSLQEQAFSMNQHDWINNTPFEGHSSSSGPSSKHAYLQTAKQNSDTLYNTEGYYHWVHGQPEYSSQFGIDQTTEAHTLGKAASLLRAAGSSELSQLRLADRLEVKGFNFVDQKKKDAYGSFTITTLIHKFNSSGEYLNSFEGVPEGTDYLQHSHAFSFPRAENQRAIVKDNADPEGLGRIKVQFPWQQRQGDATSPWIKMTTPYAGADKGFYFIPEIDEEVLVGFEGNNAERPFILSAGFNKTANSPFADPDNNIKAIKTRSGHVIELNDSNGAEFITISDKNENIITIDTANNNIKISAGENLIIDAKNIEINAAENISVGAGKNITSSAGENSNLFAKNINENADENIIISSKKSELSSEEIIVNSNSKNLTLFSGKSVDIQSNEKVKLF